MKVLIISLILIFISCTGNQETSPKPQTVEKIESAYITTVVNNFTLKLANGEGKCVLSYKKEQENSLKEEKSITLEMNAPCEFIRHPVTPYDPLFYSYKNNKIYVVIITGGPPATDLADQFMPKGCGTELQNIIISDDELKVGEKRDKNGTMCPSRGLDEAWFNT